MEKDNHDNVTIFHSFFDDKKSCPISKKVFTAEIKWDTKIMTTDLTPIMDSTGKDDM